MTTEFQATPGPWRWRAVYDDGGKISACFLESALPPEQCPARDVTVFAVREDWAGTFAENGKPKHRRALDRTLIAAAPVLQTALNNLLMATEDWHLLGEGSRNNFQNQARAALNHAKGCVHDWQHEKEKESTQ